MSSLPDLKQRLADHSARIAIVGLGYVGLPLSIRFAEAGFRVLGLDSDPDKPRLLKSGESYLRHIPHTRITEMLEAGF
jgi:UDP-N-acetyl-D-glucosamine dehydrogenase